MRSGKHILAFLFITTLGGCWATHLPGLPTTSDLLSFNISQGVRPSNISGTPHFEKTTVVNNLPGKIGVHAATITAFDDGELLAAWYAYDGPDELDGTAIYTARRLVGQSMWQPAALHIDRPESDGNPVLYSEGDSVWFFQAVVPFGWSTAHIELQQSSDRGRTWSTPKTIDGPLGANVRYPPIRMATGELILPAYDDLFHRSLFFTSTDGDMWQLTSVVSTGATGEAIQPSVVRLGDDRLLAIMRDTGADHLWVSAASPDGRSWSPPIDSGFPNPGSAAALLRLANGHLVLIYNPSTDARHPLSATLSTDEGRTWTDSIPLADGETAYSYPAAIQTPDGLIHVLYTEAREAIRHVTFNEAWLVSLS